MKLSVSILSSDFSSLGDTLKMIENSAADMIHCDIMDGVYVPNISFGPHILRNIFDNTSKPLDVHLMITDPNPYLKVFADSGARILTVHYETCKDIHKTVREIRELGMLPAVAVNPETPIDGLRDILPELFMVLIMTVHPGFGGQKFIVEMLDKIREMKRMLLETGQTQVKIQVDGGVNFENIQILKELGVDIAVAGNTVTSSKEPAKTIDLLRSI